MRNVSHKVPERDRICDFVSGMRVFVHGLDTIAKIGQCIFYTLPRESRRLSAGNKMTFVASSPFARAAARDMRAKQKLMTFTIPDRLATNCRNVPERAAWLTPVPSVLNDLRDAGVDHRSFK